MDERETLVSCLTPPGQAAIAVLAVDGPGAWEAVRPLFRTRAGAAAPAECVAAGRFLLGRFGHDAADEVVLTVRRAGPRQRLELHCHGGWANVQFIQGLLTARGVRACDWRAFLRLTESDPLRAAAAVALAEARTVRTAAILLDQYNGAFAAAIDDVASALAGGDFAAALGSLDMLAGRVALGRHLTAPWVVVVAGPPNVGKSSLVNALAGYQRSVVAPTPGTTRDVTATTLAIDGWAVELMDTAGIREATDALEMEGVRWAREAMRRGDLCLWVMDASAPPVAPPSEAVVLPVVNKIDLPPAWDVSDVRDAVCVSARTGAGLADLCAALSRRMVPDLPAAGAAVPFTAACSDALIEARDALRAGRADDARRILRTLRQAPPDSTPAGAAENRESGS